MTNKDKDKISRTVAGLILTAIIVTIWLVWASFSWRIAQEDRDLLRGVIKQENLELIK